jgi:hypothetical protein
VLIPESRAGYSRVTHPFATNPEEQAPLSSFDLHVLSTPPAFILSQDQTLRKCLIARTDQSLNGTSSATSHRNGRTGCKFETDKRQTSLLTFACCLIYFQRNLLHLQSLETTINARGFWHLTLCTLLSSQGSDAPDFHRYGFYSGLHTSVFVTLALAPGNLSNLPPSQSLSNRPERLEKRAPNRFKALTRRIIILRSEDGFLQEVRRYLT